MTMSAINAACQGINLRIAYEQQSYTPTLVMAKNKKIKIKNKK